MDNFKYKCKECKIDFRIKKLTDEHILNEHHFDFCLQLDIKKYKCIFCNAIFNKKEKLKKHVLENHFDEFIETNDTYELFSVKK